MFSRNTLKNKCRYYIHTVMYLYGKVGMMPSGPHTSNIQWHKINTVNPEGKNRGIERNGKARTKPSMAHIKFHSTQSSILCNPWEEMSTPKGLSGSTIWHCGWLQFSWLPAWASLAHSWQFSPLRWSKFLASAVFWGVQRILCFTFTVSHTAVSGAHCLASQTFWNLGRPSWSHNSCILNAPKISDACKVCYQLEQ